MNGTLRVLLAMFVCGVPLSAATFVQTAATCGGTTLNYQWSNLTTCGGAVVSATGVYGVVGNEPHLGVGTTINVPAGTPFKSAAGVRTGEFITYTNSSGPGTYLVSFDFTLKGLIDASDWSQMLALEFSFYPNYVSSPVHDTWTNGDGTWVGETTHTFHTTPFEFTVGQQYSHVFMFTITANGTAPSGATYSAVVNYLNSAVLTGGVITNLDGSPAEGVYYSIQGGSVIPLQNGTQVPEPSGLFLLPAGLALLVWRRRR